jgi:hypothetical protein
MRIVPMLLLVTANAQEREPTDPKACPVCGAGWVLYYDWVCDGKDHVLEIVGTRTYGACDGQGVLDGRQTECRESIRDVGGGGDNIEDCEFVDCDLPRPTEPCVLPPDDPPPGEVK